MRARVAVLVASLAAAPVSWPAAADGLPQLRTSPSKDPGLTVPDLTSRTPGVAPAPAWDTFSADVTIRRRMVRKDGTPGPEAPEMRYRWVRTLGDTGWKTTMTVLSVSPDVVQTSKGAQAVSRKVPVSRIEIGDARSPARIFDAEGRMLFMLPTAPPTDHADAPTSGAALPAELEAVRGAAAAFKANLASAVAAGTDAGHTPADLALAGMGRASAAHRGGTGGPARRVRAGHGIAAGSGAGARALRPRPRRPHHRGPQRSDVVRPRRDQRRARRRPRLAQRPVLRRGPWRGPRPPADPQRAAPLARERGSRARRLRALQHPPRSRRRAMTRRLGIAVIALAAAIAAARPAMAQDPPLVLLHGFKSDGTAWVDAQTRFNRQLAVTVYNPYHRLEGAVPRAGGAAAGQASGHRGRACRRRPQQRRHRRAGVEQDQADEGAADAELAQSGRPHCQQRDRLGHVQREHRRRADERPGQLLEPQRRVLLDPVGHSGRARLRGRYGRDRRRGPRGDRVRHLLHRCSRRTRSARRTCRA